MKYGLRPVDQNTREDQKHVEKNHRICSSITT